MNSSPLSGSSAHNASGSTVHNVCPHDCADTCSIHSHVEDGRLVKVDGNPTHPVTQGFLCRKVSRSPERIYGPDRLLHPMRRVGPKGAGRFERISWDEALATIAERWTSILSGDSPHAILPFCGSGTEGLVQGDLAGKRFFNRLGTLQLVRTICTRAGRTGYRYTMGTSAGADPTNIDEARLVVAWGLNAASTNIHQQTFFKRARLNGALFATVNPLRLADDADLLLRPRPGSDAALALGMMHVIVDEDLHDKDFVENATHGFKALRERIAAYPPERVSAMTDVPVEAIRTFAKLYAETQPSFIYVGPGCQRHTNAGMTVRTIACLPALVGAWRYPGGGVYFPTSTVFPVDWHPLEREDLRPNPPVGYNMIHLGRMLADERHGIRSLYVYNGNPASVLYDQNRLRAGLAREDLFTVVHELFMTDTTRYADIVLPATSQFEHEDLLYSYYSPSLLLNRRAIEPLGECRSNLDTFAALAAAMEFKDGCFRQSASDVIDDILALDAPAIAGISRGRLEADGWAPANPDPHRAGFAEGRFPTPSGRVEFYSEAMAADGYDPLPAYHPPRESREAAPGLFTRYPLFFITPSGHSFLNAAYADEEGALSSERAPTLLMNPSDADARGIAEGDLVRVFNDRGSCQLWVRIAEAARPGVVASHGQWWSRHYPDGGNANHTTPDHPADMGGGSAFNSNLVQVERLSGREAHER
ncbi:MAG: molybdopterin oxidoreductase family protein [Alphaproteobacteria bacterium]|nr:molybdopterin oxidoreductase family protein [Alphaproteobacteria bacterium]